MRHIGLQLGDILLEVHSHLDEGWVLRVDKMAGFNFLKAIAEVLNS